MADIIIYLGLGLMLVGTLYGFFVAAKGCVQSQNQPLARMRRDFHQGKASLQMRKLKKAWYIIMLCGLVTTGTGIFLGFN